MSDIIRRGYRIGKAYVNQWRERIEAIDAELAEKELQGAADTPPPGGSGGSGGSSPARDDNSTDAVWRRAQDKIRAAQGETAARREMTPEPASGAANEKNTSAGSAAADPNATDYRILGVPIGADWTVVQAAYEKLSRRCDPRRFPEGSDEQKDAQRILERVNIAYEALRKRLDPTESRFGKLEFE